MAEKVRKMTEVFGAGEEKKRRESFFQLMYPKAV